jgi:hypothetical protein
MLKIFMRSIFNLALCTIIVSTLLTSCEKDDIKPQKPPVADAGNSQVFQLPVNIATLTGSGTTENYKITGYLWSLVSGPNVPVIESPSSATTNISGLIAGKYIFQFMVIDSVGLSDVDTVSWEVKAPVQKTIVSQPANNSLEGLADSYYGFGGTGGPELPIGAWTIEGNTFYHRSFLKFDLSEIPSNATVLDAKLYLYAIPNPIAGDFIKAHSGTANAFYVERITTANWTFTGMTWAGQPVSTMSNRVLVPQSTSSFQNEVLDVKALVQDMVVNGNNGFKFQLQTEAIYNVRQYASSYYANVSLHPKLVVTFK